MKNFLFSLSFFSCISFFAQNTIPNGNFESWVTTQIIDLNDYVTPVVESQQFLGSPTTVRSTDRVSGNYSLRMETKTNGSDTLFGFMSSGEFGQSNGFSYTQAPDSLIGYYKSDVLSGDTAIFVINFSNLGTAIFDTVFSFVGSQATWSRFSFPLDVSQNPDSCFIAVASSNAINEVGVQPGSWLMLDSIVLVGSGITQNIPNFNFENWTIDTLNILSDWAPSDAVSQTTDNQEGNFALRLETVASDGDTSFITYNGQVSNGSIVGGQPFNIMADTLTGFYKYLPSGSDTAAFSMSFQKNGSSFNQKFYLFQAQSTYTSFNIPFDAGQVPDSMFVVIASSINGDSLGSVLFIDDLKLKSIVTSLDKRIEGLVDVNLYPNPVTEMLNVDFEQLNNTLTIQVIDGIGRLHYSSVSNKGDSNHNVDVSKWNTGIYYLQLKIGNKVTYRQFVKQ